MSEKDNLKEIEALLEKIKFKNEVFQRKELIGDRIIAQITKYKYKQKLHRLWLVRSAAAAAVILIIAVGGIIGSDVDITTTNQMAEYRLPDKSTVNINPNSSLKFNRISWIFDYSVELTGQATFKVQKCEKFTVKTAMGDISVLGTEFMVDVTDSTLLVECYEGSVMVKTKKGQIILTPDQKIIFDGSTMQSSIIWPEYIEFDNAPLSDVFEKLEQIYGITFKGWDKFKDILFSGIIATDNINEALMVVCNCCNIEYNINDNQVNINTL